MSKLFVVTLDQKSYTWDGRHWYGTQDNAVPPRVLRSRLMAMLPAMPLKAAKASAVSK